MSYKASRLGPSSKDPRPRDRTALAGQRTPGRAVPRAGRAAAAAAVRPQRRGGRGLRGEALEGRRCRVVRQIYRDLDRYRHDR